MYCGVHILGLPYSADKIYDYAVPESLLPSVFSGAIVLVPFGNTSRRSYAVVISLSERTSSKRTKSILTVLSPRFSLSPDMLKTAVFLSERTLSTVGEAVRTLLPPSVFSGLSEEFLLLGDKCEDGDDALVRFLSDGLLHTEKEILSAFGSEVLPRLRKMVDAGRVASVAEPLPPQNVKKKRLYAVRDRASAENAIEDGSATRLRSAGQRAILSALLSLGECDGDTLLSQSGATPAQLDGLTKKGLLSVRETEVSRNPYGHLSKKRDTSPIALSRAQTVAYETLRELSDKGSAACALLYGVTGSGKTKVILRLLDRVLWEKKKTAIVMVPEIALTPQTVGIFCSRYGSRVAVIHSGLSAGERFDAWRRIRDGECDLVIGTRSAVFAPLENLGLIVIDEEHEHTYKSDQNPKYHTRDVAAFRSGLSGALTVLASATPSVESFYKAEKGVYTLVPLRERYGTATLPETRIVDMREELRSGNRSPISRALSEALCEAKAEDKQAILFLNRRGYHSAVSCRACGEALVCPHCSITLSHHKTDGGYLLCHSCGYKGFLPKTCPSCASPHLSYVGCGTEKAETELSLLHSDMRILRMDADTTGTKLAYERILDAFRKGEGDILLGTQMVTKGHDFPNVVVSGVLLADSSLHVSDFRASERTFSLLTQVIGRAGRASHKGVAVIQTFQPDHSVIRLAAEQNYDEFYRREIALRKSLVFPPFCDIAALTLSSEDETALVSAANALVSQLKKKSEESYPSLPFSLYGPMEAQTYKVGGRFRLRILLKCRLTAESRRFLSEILSEFPALERSAGITLSVDLNPVSV